MNGISGIKENIALVREQIAAAAKRAGRDPSGIRLVAVSKTKPAEAIYEAYKEGLTAFGENYAQELNAKMNSELLSGLDNIEWHMIGHIQTNKIRSLIGKTSLIHSLDSIRLAEAIQKQAEKSTIIVDALLEINVANEKNKYGFSMNEAQKALESIAALGNIRVLGLMTSAPYTDNPESNRMYFRQLNEFFLDNRHKKIDNTHMYTLSMGMSGDYEIAIEEGSTLLRIGTRLFGSR